MRPARLRRSRRRALERALRDPRTAWLAGAGVLGAGAGIAVWRNSSSRRRSLLPARSVIISPRRSTVIAKDGAVHSAQSAELTVSAQDLERLWNATNLENLARTYWHYLTTVTLGLVRVHYTESTRMVVLLVRPLTLLRFEVPHYEFEEDHGKVTWRIRDGLLVQRRGRGTGWLSLDVRRDHEDAPAEQAKLRVEVEVSNFYPAIAAGFSTPVYEATQSLIHVLVTHAFLRSLAKLELSESKVGRLAQAAADAANAVADAATPE